MQNPFLLLQIRTALFGNAVSILFCTPHKLVTVLKYLNLCFSIIQTKAITTTSVADISITSSCFSLIFFISLISLSHLLSLSQILYDCFPNNICISWGSHNNLNVKMSNHAISRNLLWLFFFWKHPVDISILMQHKLWHIIITSYIIIIICIFIIICITKQTSCKACTIFCTKYGQNTRPKWTIRDKIALSKRCSQTL